jgi:3-oxoacyl-[acyl-carrier-protein] synthase II
MSKRRVVVTGIGIISPLGIGAEKNWRDIVAGRSGIGPITRFDPQGIATRIAGEVTGFDISAYFEAKEARKMDRFIQLGVAAGMEAMGDSGLDVNDIDADRVGVHVGSGIGGVETIEKTTSLLHQKGPRRVSPFYVPMAIINMISGNLSIIYGLRGPNLSTVTACATATHSIGDAARLIEYGDADVMLSGGAEASITPTAVAGFSNAKALSSRNDDPQAASRPWDVDRDGFVVGEGAGVVVLEELENAKARGARIYAEVAGFGMSGDAHHITSPQPDGSGASLCMSNCLRNAGLNPSDVDYVNAHGTSTQLGDLAETVAIKKTFDAHATKLAISSTKSMIGHLLGAAGGVEAAITALSLYHQIAPPTINLDSQDPECDLDYVPNQAREMNIHVALSNSFGFGGTNGTLAFKRFA